MPRIKSFVIVVKNNPASEYYAKYCSPSWEQIGLYPEIFNATTPSDLNNLSELKFANKIDRQIFADRGLSVAFTETEKACWYSHYFLWRECVRLSEPIVIMEHDSFLENPLKFWYDDKFLMIFYDKAAMGSYWISPRFAKKLVDISKKNIISTGPYSFIVGVTKSLKLDDYVVSSEHKFYDPASNQVMSEKYGSTVEHFTTSNKHLFKQSMFHKFKNIE